MVSQGAELGLLLTAALVLGGCAAPFGPAGPAGPAPLPPVGAPETPPSSTAAERTDRERSPAGGQNQAAVALLDASRESSAAGDYADAAVTLERALAIDPNNALLWIELAEVRWRQGDRSQADSLARKALTLAGSDRLVIARAERLMERR